MEEEAFELELSLICAIQARKPYPPLWDFVRGFNDVVVKAAIDLEC